MAPNPQHPREGVDDIRPGRSGRSASLCNNYTGRQHPRRVGRRALSWPQRLPERTSLAWPLEALHECVEASSSYGCCSQPVRPVTAAETSLR